jgi:succinyl-CoA synthetase alpha subunit
LPVFDTVAEAKEKTGCDASVSCRPLFNKGPQAVRGPS